jgi:hypothetical protein
MSCYRERIDQINGFLVHAQCKVLKCEPAGPPKNHSPGRLEVPRCSRRVSGGSICWRCGVSKTRNQVNAKDSLHLSRGRGAVHGTPAPRKSLVEHSTQRALMVKEHKAKSHARG